MVQLHEFREKVDSLRVTYRASLRNSRFIQRYLSDSVNVSFISRSQMPIDRDSFSNRIAEMKRSSRVIDNYPPPASPPPSSSSSSSSSSSLSPGLICACRRVVLPVCFCLCLYVSACCTRSAYASRLRALCSPLHVPPRKKKRKRKREKPCRAGSTTDERRQRIRSPDGSLHAEGRSRRR